MVVVVVVVVVGGGRLASSAMMVDRCVRVGRILSSRFSGSCHCWQSMCASPK